MDLNAADSIKSQIEKLVSVTHTDKVITKGGEFAGVVSIDDSGEAIAVSIDGVGTKLKVAFRMDKHNTVGEDLVNHCVNDIAVIGCDPICFVDYISIGKISEKTILEIIEGLSNGCRVNGVPLIGGETAQMPDIYKKGEYDLAGAIVGKLNINNQLPKDGIIVGDVLVAFSSNGMHTNGYSLARKIIFDVNGWDVDTYNDVLGSTWGDELLKVHRSYLEHIRRLRTLEGMRGFAHITGGGIPGNLSRIIPASLSAYIRKEYIPNISIFEVLQEAGGIEDEEMFKVFNMGIGLIAVCSTELAGRIINSEEGNGDTWIIGEIINRKEGAPSVIIY